MLIRYRTNSSCTIQNVQDDLNGLILGTITTVAGLSSGVNKDATEIFGTYPAGSQYARVNQSTFTYSKTHHDIGVNRTHYFRLTFDSTQLTTLTLAQSYTSGSDTLVNTHAKTINMPIPFRYDSVNKNTLDIIVNNKMVAICSPGGGGMSVMIELGHSSVTRAQADSMMLVYTDFTTDPFVNANTVNSYIYNYDLPGYSPQTNTLIAPQGVRKAVGTTSVVFENPAFTVSTGASNLVHGMYRVPQNCFAGVNIYTDSNGLYRLTFNNTSLLAD